MLFRLAGWQAVSLAQVYRAYIVPTVYFRFLRLGGTTPKCELIQHPAHQILTNPLSAGCFSSAVSGCSEPEAKLFVTQFAVINKYQFTET